MAIAAEGKSKLGIPRKVGIEFHEKDKKARSIALRKPMKKKEPEEYAGKMDVDGGEGMAEE